MTTTILSSKQRFVSLLGQQLRRNLSTSLYLLVIIFIFFPLQMFFETQRELEYIARNGKMLSLSIVDGSMMYTSVSSVCMIVILIAAALLLALVQCSYLHSKRAVDLYHSLPVSRTQLMLTGLISSFVTIAVPYIINYLINIGVSVYRVNRIASAGPFKNFVSTPIPFGEVFWDMFGWLVAIFAIMAVVNLVATQVGSTFENCVFVGVLLAAPALVIILNDIIFGEFLVGYAGSTDERVILSLTPATFMAGKMFDMGNSAYYNVVILVWLVLGAAIMWAAIWLYNRRRSEIAETSGCKGILGFVFSTVAVYLAAPLIGLIVFNGLGSDEQYVYVIGVVLGTIVSYLLVEAILNRGFDGIRKRLPQGGAVCALVIAAAVVVTTGGLGYEARLPDPARVQSVTFNSLGWYEYAKELQDNDQSSRRTRFDYRQSVTLTDKQTVGAIIAMHKQLITINQAPYSDGDYWGNYNIEYVMNGINLVRMYGRTSNEVDAMMSQLEDTEEFQREANPVLRVDPAIVSKATLHNNLGFAASEFTTQEEIKTLLEALGKDSLEQGTAPFVGGEQILCYVYFTTPLVRPYDTSLEDYQPQTRHYNSFSVPVFASYKHTLAQLGSSLPPRATAADVTEMGIGNYFYDYTGGRSDRFVSRVLDKNDREYVKSDIEGYTREQDKIEHVIDNMITTYFVNKAGYKAPLYCTFSNGTTQGITVMLRNEDIPADMFDEFPELKERYQNEEDQQAITKTVVETVVLTNTN